MKKIAIFGCKTTTQFILEAVNEVCDVSYLVTIDETLGIKNQVADYSDLSEVARSLNVMPYLANSYDLKDVDDIRNLNEMKIDLAFVIGWQRLIPGNLLQNMSIGAFGMHGSSMNLPLGRGRSPMNWSIIEDRQFFYTNLFKYDAGVDSGEILDSFVFSINPNDTAETMHFKNSLAMKRLVLKNLSSLLENDFNLKKQLGVPATYYPKRRPSDSLIDWERDIFYLDRHIRAVSRPFNGAYTFVNGDKIRILRANIFETELVDFGYRDSPYGCVLEVFPNGKFIVRCRGGILIVHEFETNAVVSKNMQFTNRGKPVKYFGLNRFGNHDV